LKQQARIVLPVGVFADEGDSDFRLGIGTM
jgi:hypothetical protein